jgi:hypothetical protein
MLVDATAEYIFLRNKRSHGGKQILIRIIKPSSVFCNIHRDREWLFVVILVAIGTAHCSVICLPKPWNEVWHAIRVCLATVFAAT